MLKSAFEARGHEIKVWTPQAKVHRLFDRSRFAKWAGYIDQYVLFPFTVRRALTQTSADTLFVFCDQALGPWMPLVKSRPHVVHAHDLLALRSALGQIPENPTSFTGRMYQRYIRRGFRTARHFISVSKKTRQDLQDFGGVEPLSSDVVYNGLNFPYAPLPENEASRILRAAGLPEAPGGMLLNVGGAQWYKNQPGVIALYARYAASAADPLPLWCVGPKPSARVLALVAGVPPRGRIHFLSSVTSEVLQAAYSRARVFLFPSLAEGFGWPLIEAQACGCPVLTTDEPPMSEVAGDAAVYVPRLQFGANIDRWADTCAGPLLAMLAESPADRAQRVERGRLWARGFDADLAADRYLDIYSKVLAEYS